MKITWPRFILCSIVVLVICRVAFENVRHSNLLLAAILSIIVNFGFLIIILMFPCLCIWKIAVKTNTEPRWMAWVPGLWLFVVCKIVGIWYWWAFLSICASIAGLFPILGGWAFYLGIGGFLGIAYLLIKIPRVLGENDQWAKYLMVVPLVNYFYMGYLVFRTEKPASEVSLSAPSEEPQPPQPAPIATSPDDALSMSASEGQPTPPQPESATKAPSLNPARQVVSMNNKQRFVGVLGAAVFALALFLPPWLFTYDRNGADGGHATKPAGFSCILSPPAPEGLDEHYGVRIDTPRLLVECLFILAVGGASWFWMGRDTASKPPQPAPLAGLYEAMAFYR